MLTAAWDRIFSKKYETQPRKDRPSAQSFQTCNGYTADQPFKYFWIAGNLYRCWVIIVMANRTLLNNNKNRWSIRGFFLSEGRNNRWTDFNERHLMVSANRGFFMKFSFHLSRKISCKHCSWKGHQKNSSSATAYTHSYIPLPIICEMHENRDPIYVCLSALYWQ